MSLGSLPVTAFAVDPSAPFVLPGVTLTAVTADVDGDGAREVVRLAEVSGAQVLEVWDLVDGTWARTFSVEVERLIAPGVVVTQGMLPIALARTRVAGGERVLVLGTGYDPERGVPACCFTVHEIVDSGGDLEAHAVAAPDLAAEAAVIVDVDGDGTDELAVSYIQWDDSGNATGTSVELLRREGDRLAPLAAWQDEGGWWFMPPVDADGAPGFELLASGDTGEVVRLGWVDGAMVEGRSSLLFDGQQGWITGGTTGALLVALPTEVALVEWPSGGEVAVTATYETRDYPTVGILGSGRDALFVVQDHLGSGAPASVVQVLDANLEPVGEVTVSPEAEALWQRLDRLAFGGWTSARSIWPYVGPADGDWSGRSGSYLIGGMRITAGRAGTFEARPTSAMLNQPVGTAGPDGAWVALADGFYPNGPVVYPSSGVQSMESRLVLASEAALLRPVDRQLVTSVSFEGALETGRTDDVVTLLAAPTGAEIVLTVAPDTVVVSWDGQDMQDHGANDTTVRLSIPGPRRPPRDGRGAFEREVLLIGPEGNVTFHRWEGTFASEAPELTAWTRAETLSMEATVAGRAALGSTVTVDGIQVTPNAFGAYRTTVEAPPWPRNVVVVARDPFGGESRATVEVIGLVDYRGLPWLPIAGVATLLGGAVLFLRTPGHRSLTERVPIDDGRLEDLDGDLV